MKIAFLNYYQKSTARGLESWLTELSSRLSKNNDILIAPSPQKINFSKQKLSILRRLFLDRNSLSIALWSFKQIQEIYKFKPKIIFSLNGGWQTLIFKIYSLLTKTKLIIAGHSGPGWDDRWNLFMSPDIFICLTQRQLDWAKKATIWKNQKFVVIPNGVDLKKFNPSARVEPLQLQKPIICIAAASEKSKNIDKTIKAVSLLKKGSLLVLGQGSLDKEIDNLGKKLLKGNYLHLSVKNAQMPEYYKACNLFTMCSESSEAFGIVYLEALSCNLPVVATDDLSRRQIIENAGLYVKNPADAKEYANTLQKALDKNWGNLPQIQAQKFDWDKIAKEYNDLFLGLYK